VAIGFVHPEPPIAVGGALHPRPLPAERGGPKSVATPLDLTSRYWSRTIARQHGRGSRPGGDDGEGRVGFVDEGGTRALLGRLVEAHGTAIPGLTHAFPAAETLATADLDASGLPPACTASQTPRTVAEPWRPRRSLAAAHLMAGA
jgi:hypothetical protein